MIPNADLVVGLSELRPKVGGGRGIKTTIKDRTKTALDALQAGAAASQDLNQRRRDSMRKDLHPSHRDLCNAPKEESETLFGDDLTERLKPVNLCRQLGMKISNESYIGKRPFLGHSRPQPHRQKPDSSRE